MTMVIIILSATDLQNRVVRVLVSTGLHDGGGGCFGGLFTHVRSAKPARRTDRREDRDGGWACQRRISEKKNWKNFEMLVGVAEKFVGGGL